MSAVRTTISEADLSEMALDALHGFGFTRQDAADASRILVMATCSACTPTA